MVHHASRAWDLAIVAGAESLQEPSVDAANAAPGEVFAGKLGTEPPISKVEEMSRQSFRMSLEQGKSMVNKRQSHGGKGSSASGRPPKFSGDSKTLRKSCSAQKERYPHRPSS